MEHFNLIKSLTRVNNIITLPFREGHGVGLKSIKMGLLCLSLATLGVNDAWGGTYYGSVDAYSSPAKKGWIWVTLKGSKFNNFENDEHDSSSNSKYVAVWESSADFTAQFYAKPKDGYGFKGWFDNASGTGTNYSSSTSNNCSYSCTLTSKSKDESNPAKLVRYAVFAPSSASVTTNTGVTAQDVSTPIDGNVVFTVSNADALADFKKPESITTISGIGSFSVGAWSYSNGKITINYTYTPNNTSKETKGELKLVSAGGENTCTATIIGKANKKKTSIIWDVQTFILNKDEEISNPAHAVNGASVKYKFDSGTATDVISIVEKDGIYTLRGEKMGRCKIVAYVEGDDEVWDYMEDIREFVVTNKQKQIIDWTQKLSFDYSGVKVTSPLTATAKTNITYSIPADAASWVSIDGETLIINGIGETTITATAEETENYIGVSVTRTLIARDPTATCDDLIYDDGNSHEFSASGGNHTTSIFPKHPRSMTFWACKSMATAVGYLQIDEYYSGGWHKKSTIDVGDLDKDNLKKFGPYDLNYNTTQVRFTCNSSTGIVSYKRTIAKVEVLQAKTISANVSSINLEAQLGAQQPYTFYVSYDNVQGPLYITCDEASIVCPTEINADCGDAAVNVPVTIQLNPTASFSNKTITISDKKNGGRTLNIPISAIVSKNTQSIIWNDETTYQSTDLVTLTGESTAKAAGLVVSYTSKNTNIAKIVNGNQVQFVGSGLVDIIASQAGNDYYESATDVTKTFTIKASTPIIVTMPSVVNGTITYGSKLSDVALTGGSAKDDKGNAVTGHFVWANPDEIPHGGQQQYTVRFVPDNTNMYASDAVSTETLTITVNKADQTVTWDVEDPIKVKKEDGDYTLTASSTSGRTITYTISNTEHATINGNILTPLKSGDCTITAVCPADNDYNVSNIVEKQLFIAGPDEIIWKYKNGDHVWAGQNLNAKGDLATAHTTVYFGKDETQWHLMVDNGTDPKTVYTASASDDVLVTISASTSGDEYYSQVSSAIHVYIDRCYQGLVWDQNFLTYLADEQGHIDETVDLTAYAVDSLNRETNLPIVYSVDNTAVAEVLGDATNGWKLHIKGAGSATLTASVAQTNIYQGVTETRKINVRKMGERCGSYALISTGEKKISDIGDNTYTFGVPGETLTFKTRKYSVLTLNADVTVQGYNIVTQAWEHIDTYSLSSTDKTTKTYTIKEDFRAIKMFTGADLENSYRYISDLYITQKEYIRSSVDKIDEKIYINQDFSKTFTVDYSDKPYISCTIDNNQLEILRDDDSNTCGEYGTITFTVKNKNTWLTPTTIKGNITLSTSVGDNIIIPVTIQVDLGGTYKFTNKLGDNDWNNLQNWDYGGSVPTSLPDIMNQILVQQPVRITNEVKVYELQVQTDKTQGWDGSVTIAPTGGLTIYNGGAIGIDGKLTIESSREHTGYFRVVPDVVQQWVATPTATMQYASKGSLDSGANRDATWQYFGIPVKGADFTVDYITWMYEWSEPNGWIDLKSQSQPVHLKPFQGYAITQYGQPTYNFTGSLNMGEVDLHLTYTEGNGMWGDNMFANSYPSPIDVKLFTEEDVQDLDHRTIYLYNSGSWNQWNEGTQGGDWGHLTDGAGAPGTFTAIPILAATYLETEQTLIAPMQGMCIHTDKKEGATVHLDYAKHVWDAMPSGSKDDMNAPLLTPTRKKSSQKPEGVSDEAWENIQYAQARHDSIEEAHKQKVAELRHRVRLTVYGENSGVDHIYLLEKDGFTADYDNGYDAYKMFSDGLLNVYTSEDFGEMAVSASDKLEGTFIGINAGDGEAYQLKVSSVIGDNLYLKDLLNGAEIPLQEGQMYMFNAVPKLKEAQRFVIVERENQGVGTSLDGVMGGDAYIWTDNENVHIEQAAANTLVRLFSSDGKLITTTTVNGSGEINISTLPNNVYMVMLNEQTYKFVKK